MIEWVQSLFGVSPENALNTIVAVGVAVFGACVTVWTSRRTEKQAPSSQTSAISLDANTLADKYADEARKRGALEAENANLRNELAERDGQAEKALAAAIENLKEDAEEADDRAPFDRALAELAEGRPDDAEDLFQKILERRKAEGQTALKEAAEAARHIGAIAFYHDTQKALNAYAQATELNPDDAEAWNRLGHLQFRVGKLNEANAAYRQVLRLGNSIEDKELVAAAYGNLGIVLKTRGDLDGAEQMYRKSLEIEEALGRKEGMASDYGNLGIVMEIRGDPAEACRLWGLSRGLYAEIGMDHMVERVEGWMRDAGCDL